MKDCKNSLCGKEFSPSHYAEKYCSEICRREEKRKRERDRKRNKITKPVIKCLFCDLEFMPETYYNLKRTKFCSDKCRYNYEYYGGKKPKEKRILKIPAPRLCVICNQEFTPAQTSPKAITCGIACNIKRQHQKSRTNRNSNPKELPIKNCEYCSSEFKPAHWRHKFCNIKCNKKFHNEKSRENGRINYELCMQRDEYKCVWCSSLTKLNVHHLNLKGESAKKRKKFDNTDNRVENLITLCRKCHYNIHTYKFAKNENDEWNVNNELTAIIERAINK